MFTGPVVGRKFVSKFFGQSDFYTYICGMRTTSEIYSVIPGNIKAVLRVSEGWLVGSSIEQLLNDQQPKDFDILVADPELFQKAACHLKASMGEPKLNTFGGLKFSDGEVSIDIWCETLDHFILNGGSCEYFFNLERRIALEKLL